MMTLLVTLDDQYHPNYPVSIFCIPFHIFVMGEHRDFKFSLQIDHSKSQLIEDKVPEMGVVMPCNPFKILVPLKYP